MSVDTERLRLESIKLVGFKSFVDPTTIPLPSNLVAVVGPNGCGKSNIIDAVCWVMGESSAKQLRGESMTDVIFNGSSGRKPVGLASIELVFDNPNGALGGAYAQYQKIAIRRQITREGQSKYFLNNSHCRRRDIVDLFLGTGLGPRSYSIIGQGTISRLIEAKPEELRVFLEEAAGISKYKERRRETENRIRHARENLDRLNDLREELTKQLAHLQRQAKAAERYRELKTEEHELKSQLLGLRWRVLDKSLQEYAQQIRTNEVELAAVQAKAQEVELAIEERRELHIERQDTFNNAQESFYSIGAQVARLEQSLQHQQERHRQMQTDLQEVAGNEAATLKHWRDDESRIFVLQQEIETLTPQYELLQETVASSQHSLKEQEQSQQDWQSTWDEFNRDAAKASQEAHVQQTRIQHLEQTIQQTKLRLSRLQEEHHRLDCSELESELQMLAEQQSEAELQVVEEQHQLDQLRNSIDQYKQTNDQLVKQLDETRSQLQKMRGRYASLEALQQVALGQQGLGVVQWLKDCNVAQNPRLAQTLQVEQGWEVAVETVLGQYLQAVCVGDIEPLTAFLDQLKQGEVSFFMTQAEESSMSRAKNSLQAKVNSEFALDSLLAGVFVAEDLTQALALKATLASHESVVTRQGLWLGPNWLRVIKEKDEKAGVLQRQQAIKELQAAIAQQEEVTAQIEQDYNNGQTQLKTQEKTREQAQAAVADGTRAVAEIKAQLRVTNNKLEQLQSRNEQLSFDIEEQQEQIQTTLQTLEESKVLWHQAMQKMELHADKREQLQKERDANRQILELARQKHRENSEALHQLSLSTQRVETELKSKIQQKERLQHQLESLVKRRQALEMQLANSDEPVDELRNQLDELLEKQVVAEDELNIARRMLQELEHELREIEKQKQSLEHQAIKVREQLEQRKMQHQAVDVRRTTIAEQLQDSKEELEIVIQNLPESANDNEWEQRLGRVVESIHRLGAINLAAIDEYQSQSERKNYLDAQHDDLVQALEILEDAIRKIDKETRQRFRETYEKVNQTFQELFPKIFAGGTAYLELIGEDLLDTGVAVMARPPGKRNSTIHLLSGGEKALTAIALVFAIFQLNPSPFCLLDEVDAPLDDANVGRFCNLVKEMSKEVQFIFISHNKVAIEMADHLVGVTMKEPGVSRMVSVDFEQAMSIVES